jgi:hypothetical protein
MDFEAAPAVRRIIGVHINLNTPGCLAGLGLEHPMLAHILTGALRRRSLLIEKESAGADSCYFNEAGKILAFAYERKIFAMAPVTDTELAVATVIHELTAIDLISGAHLATINESDCWQTVYPLPEPMPWENHLKEFNAWAVETPEQKRARMIKFAQRASDILADLGNKEEPQAPQ